MLVAAKEVGGEGRESEESESDCEGDEAAEPAGGVDFSVGSEHACGPVVSGFAAGGPADGREGGRPDDSRKAFSLE